jgi:hypothetical protein
VYADFPLAGYAPQSGEVVSLPYIELSPFAETTIDILGGNLLIPLPDTECALICELVRLLVLLVPIVPVFHLSNLCFK